MVSFLAYGNYRNEHAGCIIQYINTSPNEATLSVSDIYTQTEERIKNVIKELERQFHTNVSAAARKYGVLRQRLQYQWKGSPSKIESGEQNKKYSPVQ